MTEYRRAHVAGAMYFFTVNLAERHGAPLLVQQVHALREVMQTVRLKHPFEIIAAVVLPDHLHAIWQLPQGDADYANRWSLIKSGFSRHLPKTERISASRAERRERGIWQRRYWEHLLRDEEDLRQHVEYIHYNPVKHGHCASPIDWPHSSFHRYVRQGLYAPDWAADTRIATLQLE